jgi:hypothetical protein
MSDEESGGAIEPGDQDRSSPDILVPPKRELVPLPGLVAIAF